MNVAQLQFLAASTADLDWQKVGGNENPYNPTTQSESYTAYEICFEYDEFRRGAP